MSDLYDITRKGRTAIDDRGRRVGLEWAKYDRFTRYFDQDTVKAFRRIDRRRQILFKLNPIQVKLASLGCFLLLICLGFLLAPAVLQFGGLVFLLLCCVCIWADLQGDTHPQIARFLRKRQSCIGCGYELARCRIEEDGCTVCPECGAAWRLGEVGDGAEK